MRQTCLFKGKYVPASRHRARKVGSGLTVGHCLWGIVHGGEMGLEAESGQEALASGVHVSRGNPRRARRQLPPCTHHRGAARAQRETRGLILIGK